MERMVAELKATPRAEGFDEIFYPGEIEARNEEANETAGLDLPDLSREALATLAQAPWASRPSRVLNPPAYSRSSPFAPGRGHAIAASLPVSESVM